MKLTFRIMLAALALAVTALGSTATAEASPSLSIGGSGAYVAPYASGGSVQIVDPCINLRWHYSGSYVLLGAVRCGESLDRRWTFRDWQYYDRSSGRYVGTGRCWYDAYSGAFWGCVWL